MCLLSCLKKFSCCTIVVVNVFGILLGLIISVLGGILLWGAPLLKSNVLPLLKNILSVLPNENLDIGSIFDNAFRLLESFGIVIFILGIITLAISIIGCCGACCDQRVLLIIYCVAVGLVFLGILAVIIIFGSNKALLLQNVDDFLMSNIKTQFTDFNNMNAFTLILSFLQMQLNCCGVNNGTDFQAASNWNRTFSIEKENYKFSTQLIYPVSCCKSKNFVPIDYENCVKSPTSDNSNHEQGCSKKVRDELETFNGPFYGVAVALLVISGVMFALAIVMIVAIFRDVTKVSPI